MVYFRFLSIKNAAMPMTQANATTAIMAISVVMNGASAVGSVGVGVVGSDSIEPPAVGASPTFT